LGVWSAEERSRGDTQSVQAFHKQRLSITYRLAPGRHGFNPSFQNLDLAQVEAELHALVSDLADLDVQPFLNGSTLLRYFGDGHPIPHDDDFDLGILVKGDTENEAAKNGRRFVKEVGEKVHIIDKGTLVALKLSNGVEVDLFACWTVDGNSLSIHIAGQMLVKMHCSRWRTSTFAAATFRYLLTLLWSCRLTMAPIGGFPTRFGNLITAR
jgi:hypothetical protein|tara:strand:- start:218 stop:850 length:633 start_codon:yes stop_codon:yes gene_type:complete